MNSPEIQRMIQLFSRLPGLGPRSGRRIALHLLKKREVLLKPLIEALQTADQHITICHRCFNLDTNNPCYICKDSKRDIHSLCIVADVADLWAIERSQIFKGTYHVLGGLLSALDNIGPQQLTIQPLLKRLETENIQETILALNPTVDGQTTVHYLANHLKAYPVKLSSLAQGVPMGGELDYLDDGTLSAAFSERKKL